MAIIAFSSAIGPIPIDCIIRESPSSELDVTEIPIESGAKVTDHALVLPKKITLEIGDSNGAATYAALVALQETREPFTVISGLTVIPNMLIKRINADRDAQYSNVLKGTVDLQEIVIVSTAYASDPNGDSTGTRGKAGGKNSTRAAPSDSSRAAGIAAERSTGTVQRGDAGVTTTTANQSIASSLFN